MTFRVYYYADQAFLSSVKRMISQFETYTPEQKRDFEAETVSVCIISCHAATEAFLNMIAIDKVQDFKLYEGFSIESKMNLLYDLYNQKPDWNKLPLQDIKRMVKVRNWLTHYKNPDIGLMNSMGHWVIDSHNKKPKIDDGIELKIKSIKRCYTSIRNALYQISELLNINQYHNYLIDEDYNSYVIG